MVDQDPLREAVLHDLAGTLTSVHGLAVMADNKKEHPSRDQFISLLRGEAAKAAQAVKDLQMLEVISADLMRLEEVAVLDFYRAVVARLPGEETPSVPAPPSDVPSLCLDVPLTADVIARCSVEVAASEGSCEWEADPDALLLKMTFGPAGDEATVRDGLASGHKNMRPFALARTLLARSGGGADFSVTDQEPLVELRLPLAGGGSS